LAIVPNQQEIDSPQQQGVIPVVGEPMSGLGHLQA
jgi:hypothetical protein